MGRHAKRAARLRVSVSTVVLGTLIVTVVAVGSLLSSYAEPAPTAADGVAGAAVEESVTDGRLLPYGLVLAALLAAGAAAAVLVDVRRGRRARARAHAAPRGRQRGVATRSPAAQQASAQQVAAPDLAAPDLAAPDGTDPGTSPPHRAAGRHARPDADSAENSWAGPGSPSLTWISQPTTAPPEFVERQPYVDRALSSVDLSFPFTASLADSLHDELFTHRAVRS